MRRQLRFLAVPALLVVCCSPAAAAARPVVPSGTGGHAECSNCHSTDTAAADAKRPADRCVECHAGYGEPGSDAAGMHLGFGCTGCHDPHRIEAPFRFRRDRQSAVPAVAWLDAETRLCVACHAGFAEARGMTGAYVRHPVGVAVAHHAGNVIAAADRPVHDLGVLPLARGTTAAGYVTDVVGCGTCHHLHGNPNAKLLRWAPDRESDACLGCHADATGAPVLAGE